MGRTEELELLRGQLAAARSGQGSLVLIQGEAGIGKTTLARTAVAEAREGGATVLWGRGYDGGWSPPYTPWLEALRSAGIPDDDIPALEPKPASDESGSSPGEAQFKFHQSMSERLRALAESAPLVVALDDLHWADSGSIDLLRHMAHFSLDQRICLIGTLRDADIAPEHPLAQVLPRLSRLERAISIRLGGLRRDDVIAMLASGTSETVSADEVEGFLNATSGNPLFLAGIAENRRALDAGDDGAFVGAFPPAVNPIAQIAQARLARLSPEARLVVNHAAVFSAGFDFAVLPALTELSEDSLLDVVDELIQSGLIEPKLEGGPERYDFAHALIREAIVDRLNPSRRVRLERKAAEAMERAYAGSVDERAPELAIQYGRSASLAGSERGLPYALAAAARARRGFDRQQTVFFLRIARDLVAGTGAETRVRVFAELALAESDAVQIEHAEATAIDAIRMLETSGASAGEIAGFYADLVTSLKQHASAESRIWRPFLEAGLAVAGANRDHTWARLMLLLDPVEPIPSPRIRAGRWIGFDPEAIAIARGGSSERAAARSVESFDFRSRQDTAALLAQVRGWRDPEAIMYGLTVVANDYQYRHGAFRAAEEIWNELIAIAARQGALNWQAQATNQLTLIHIAAGRFAEARACETKAIELLDRLGAGRRPDVLEREMATALAVEFGGAWATLGAEWKAVAEDPTLGPRDPATLMNALNAAVSAYCFVEAGDERAARSMLEVLTPILEALSPFDPNQNGAVAVAAAAVWRLRLAELAPRYLRLASDLRENGLGDYPQTSIELTIARMLALGGRFDDALRFVRAGREILEDSGQYPQLAQTFLDEAEIRRMGGMPDGVDAAVGALRHAIDLFNGLGTGFWSSRATELLAAISADPTGPAILPAGLTDREVEVMRLVARGYSDQRISELLFISRRTVNTHIRNMLNKTGANNRTELSVWAVERGLARGGEAS